ncbi:LamG domain-containing protein [bacterium]|nr:LamG domain-containing protein [bacterium]
MAINFPDNPSDGDIASIGGVTYTYTASANSWKPPAPGASASTLTDLNISDGTSGQLLTTDGNNNFSFTSVSSASSTEIFADMAALIAKTGMNAGDQGLVLDNNKLFMYTGSAWYLIATMVNNSPTAITNVNSSYDLSIDGTPTVITATSTDPEGFPLTWSYAITSGSLGSTATISQVDNVFTITPSTNSVDAGEFSITFSATDGGSSGIVNKVTSISLAFAVANSRYTTLLATATGTSDNNNITDSSTNNHVITVQGDPRTGTFSPYRNGGYSTYFDGSGGDYLQLPSDAGFSFGTGDFTVECWVYYPPIANTNGKMIIDSRPTSTNGSYWNFGSTSTGILTFATGGNTVSDTVARPDQWVHYAVTRSGTSLRLFANGTLVASTTDSSNISSGSPTIGKNAFSGQAGDTWWLGYISNLRIVKGTAVYTSNFTPPTEAFESDANTELLISNSLPYIKDSSSNSHDITVTGDVSIMPFGPYDYGEYDPSIHGGSVYFDGTGDYIDTNTNLHENFGTGDYTVEAWVYLDETIGSNRAIFGSGTSDSNDEFTLILLSSGQLYFDWGNSGQYIQQSSSTFTANTWHHVAITRSGTQLDVWLDGVSAVSSSSHSFDYTGTSTFKVGMARNGSFYWKGYITDARIVNGAAVYSGDFTPPTAPLSSSGSSLHIKGTDASIIDKSQTTNIQLFGNTTGSTTQVKFADSKSMYFDGAGDYLETSSTSLDNFNFGTGDFTVECFLRNVYQSGSYFDILGTANNAGYVGSNRGGWMLSYYTSQQLRFSYQYNNAWIFENSFAHALNINTWYHIAVTRQGTQLKCFVDGNQVGSTITDSTNLISTEPFNIGRGYGGTVTTNSYIQDVRITKGLARYTANFTPPAEPLKG